MKRGLEHCQEASASLTPSKSASRFLKPPLKSISKRSKQGTIRRFCITKDQDETPIWFASKKPTARDTWSSGAQRKLERLAVSDKHGDGQSSGNQTHDASNLKDSLAKQSTPEVHDDFYISCTQDYERGSQMALGTPELMPCGEPQETCLRSKSFRFMRSSQASVTEELGVGVLSFPTQQTTQPAEAGPCLLNVEEEDHEDALTQTMVALPDNQAVAAGENHATTPDLGALWTTLDDAMSLARPLFNIFLPKSEQRHLIIIRHGESEFNRAVEEGKCFKDPMIFDPHLTQRGREQARGLRESLRMQLAAHGDALWVISPLRRAIETFMHACPLLHGGQPPPSPTAAQGSCQAAAQVPEQAGQQPALSIEVMPTIAEFLVTAGDVGSKTSQLAKEFPSLSSQLAKVPEQWWFQEANRPNCAVQKLINSREPKAHQKKRVSELARWLSKRPEKFIIMIGHCSFWKEFSKISEPMKNGEMRCMRW